MMVLICQQSMRSDEWVHDSMFRYLTQEQLVPSDHSIPCHQDSEFTFNKFIGFSAVTNRGDLFAGRLMRPIEFSLLLKKSE
jgi:hypothetical protein